MNRDDEALVRSIMRLKVGDRWSMGRLAHLQAVDGCDTEALVLDINVSEWLRLSRTPQPHFVHQQTVTSILLCLVIDLRPFTTSKKTLS